MFGIIDLRVLINGSASLSSFLGHHRWWLRLKDPPRDHTLLEYLFRLVKKHQHRPLPFGLAWASFLQQRLSCRSQSLLQTRRAFDDLFRRCQQGIEEAGHY